MKALLAEEGQANPSHVIRLTDPTIRQFWVTLLFTQNFAGPNNPQILAGESYLDLKNIYSVVLGNGLCDLG